MDDADRDMQMRIAAFEHVRRLGELHDHLTATESKQGFLFDDERIPGINPRRDIFKPRQMRFLLSIKTVFPKPGGKVWYDDQRAVHRQIFESDETVDYAFMGQNSDAADNRWLREAYEHQVPIIYFLGISPGRYHAILPTFIPAPPAWSAPAWDRESETRAPSLGTDGLQTPRWSKADSNRWSHLRAAPAPNGTGRH
jgi:putative restriction endonuclease